MRAEYSNWERLKHQELRKLLSDKQRKLAETPDDLNLQADIFILKQYLAGRRKKGRLLTQPTPKGVRIERDKPETWDSLHPSQLKGLANGFKGDLESLRKRIIKRNIEVGHVPKEWFVRQRKLIFFINHLNGLLTTKRYAA